MKKFTTLLMVSGVFLLGGCADDNGVTEGDKGAIDVEALEGGITVELNDDIGTLEIPFDVSVPEADEDDLRDAIDDSLSLVVRSTESSSAAGISAGTLVDGTPDSPGEWAWGLNDERDLATITFYNETPGGLTLKSGNDYTATFAVSLNEFLESVSAMAFDVTVE